MIVFNENFVYFIELKIQQNSIGKTYNYLRVTENFEHHRKFRILY